MRVPDGLGGAPVGAAVPAARVHGVVVALAVEVLVAVAAVGRAHRTVLFPHLSSWKHPEEKHCLHVPKHNTFISHAHDEIRLLHHKMKNKR